jgi:hypothetical protein
MRYAHLRLLQEHVALQSRPLDSPSPTYLNVFTVEEYESNGKSRKKWMKIGAS